MAFPDRSFGHPIVPPDPAAAEPNGLWSRVKTKLIGRPPRDAARPLVFTNGVFDVLHRGHVTYLARARDLGAALLVGLNSDHSARGLRKGPDRPFNNELDRALVLASLQAVDFVMVFDEPTPCALLERVRPDIYVKGGDYDVEGLAETALVRGWGGRSLAMPFVEGYSTSAMLERVRGTS
jgi:rfaE bifunctional protein nucleotidyltransferase chain/domain